MFDVIHFVFDAMFEIKVLGRSYPILWLQGIESINKACCFKIKLKFDLACDFGFVRAWVGQDAEIQCASPVRIWPVWITVLEERGYFYTLEAHSVIYKLHYFKGLKFFYSTSIGAIILMLLKNVEAVQGESNLLIFNQSTEFKEERNFIQKLSNETDLEFMTWHINHLKNYWIFREDRNFIVTNHHLGNSSPLKEILIYPKHSAELFSDELKVGYDARVDENHMELSTNIAGLNLGFEYRFETNSDLYKTSHANNYWICSIEHFYSHVDHCTETESHDKARGYFNKVRAYPVGSLYEPNLKQINYRTASGYHHGIVEGQEKKAFLSSSGEYKVRVLADLTTSRSLDALPWMSKMSSYGGVDTGQDAVFGFNNPLQAGAEVVIGYLENNVDKPFLLGALPNSSNASSVVLKNEAFNCWKVYPGHCLQVSDHIVTGGWSMSTVLNQQKVALNSGGNFDVEAVNQNGILIFKSAEDVLLKTETSIDITIENQHDMVVSGDFLTESGNHLKIESAKDTNFHQDQLYVDSSCRINLLSHDFVCQAKEFDIEAQYFVLHSKKEDVIWQAGEVIEISGLGNEDVVLSVGSANKIILSKTGIVRLISDHLSIHSDTVSFNGSVLIENEKSQWPIEQEFETEDLLSTKTRTADQCERNINLVDLFERVSGQSFFILNEKTISLDGEKNKIKKDRMVSALNSSNDKEFQNIIIDEDDKRP